jgi:hypothetical protein
MKKITFFAAIAMIAFTTNAVAQATATGTSTATVVAPIGITSTATLAFGNLAVVEAGTVLLTSANVRSQTGGVTLTANEGTFNPAGFSVTGEATYAYTLTLPLDTDVALSDLLGIEGGPDMTVTAFESSLTDNKGVIGTNDTFTVGATLNVAAGQDAGSYEGDFDVTVEYD